MNATEPARILVIDDDELTLAILRRLLEAEHYVVEVNTSAAKALATFPENHYDAILCDMWMEGMSGKDFYLQLKRDFPEYGTRVIFVTGDLASEVTWEFIDERHLPYVLKPFNRVELQRKLREIVGERPAPVPTETPAQFGQGGLERRRRRRVPLTGSIRVRRKKWAVGGPDVGSIVNVSKGGVLFLTDRSYRVGMEVFVTFPYTGYEEFEQEGFVVRVQREPDGRQAVAVALGEDAEAARAAFEGSKEDTRRHHIVQLPEDSRAPSGLEAAGAGNPAKEQREYRQLAEEFTELRSKHDAVIDQRDQLAEQEAQLDKQLQELTQAKAAMTHVLDHLKDQMGSLREQLDATEDYRYRATHDSLTGVWNRAAILDLLKRELVRAQREASLVAVILADLDHFKNINDTYGHLAGDAVLREATRRINSAVRSYDAVGRYGGEEFLIVLSGCQEDVVLQAERIREIVSAEPVRTDQGPIPVTLSLGAVSTDGLHEVEEVIHAADDALYEAKRGGRNRVVRGSTPDPIQNPSL